MRKDIRMEIGIITINMPKNCKCCPFLIRDMRLKTGLCAIWENLHDDMRIIPPDCEKPYWCPVQKVPDAKTDLTEMTLKIKESEDYKKGYAQALEDISTPCKAIQEAWNPSKCPRCKKSFHDYEPCDDGYYKRTQSLERCPYCGQKLEWF